MEEAAVTDLAINTPALTRRPRTAKSRPRIQLPDGDELVPRQQFADEVGFTDRTARKLNLPTTYIANTAYVLRNASLAIIAARVQSRNDGEPQRRRPGRKPAR